MVGCEDVVIQLQVKDWKGLASFGDFCITATFQGCSQETRRCREARRTGRLPLLYVWKQRRQRLPRMRSADVRVEVSAEARMAFLHISLREAQDMLSAPDKPESYSWRQLVGGGRGAQLLVGAFFRPAASCDLQPPATAPHSPAGQQKTPVHSRPHSGKSGVDFIWDADNQFFRMEPPTMRDELYRFAAHVREARDLDLLVLGHRGRGGGGGLRLEVALGGFPALTAGALANALATPSADDRSALCFRGSIDAFQQAACAEPASLQLVDGRGNRIGYANFQLGTLLSGQQFKDFSAGDETCNLFEAEHVLTMACDEQGSVPKGADGSQPTVTLAASLRRVSPCEWRHRGQLATSCGAAHALEPAGRLSSSSVSPAHYSPVSSSRSLGAMLGGDEESAGETGGRLGDLVVSAAGKRSRPTLPTESGTGSGLQSSEHCPLMPHQESSGDEIPVLPSSPSSVSQDRSRSFPDIIPDQSLPLCVTSPAVGGGNEQTTARHTLSPHASDSETRFILEHVPLLELSEGTSKRIPSGSSSSLSDLSPSSSCAEISKCRWEPPVNRTISPIKKPSASVNMASPTTNSSETAEKASLSTVPCLILDTDSTVSGREAVKPDNRGRHGEEWVRAVSNVVQSFSRDDQPASPQLSEEESVTSPEIGRFCSSDKDETRCHSPPPINKSPTDSQYWAIKRRKRDRRKHSSDHTATKSHPHSQIAPDTSGKSEVAEHLDDAKRKGDLDRDSATMEKKSSPSLSLRGKRGNTEKLTREYYKVKSTHVMFRARYTLTKITVFDESLCGILFLGFQHRLLEEKGVLSKVVIRDPNETIAPDGVVGTVRVCSHRGHVLEQVAALPPMLNVSHHKVRCDPHLVQAELSFVVAEPGKFALYRVATGEVVGTVHVNLRVLGPYHCPPAVCTQLGSTCLPRTVEELCEDGRQWSSGEGEGREDGGNHGREILTESGRDAENGIKEWREREMEVLAYIDDMYADVCRMTEETQMLQEREEWFDPNVRRVWFWRLEALEERYKRACQEYWKHYGIRR